MVIWIRKYNKVVIAAIVLAVIVLGGMLLGTADTPKKIVPWCTLTVLLPFLSMLLANYGLLNLVWTVLGFRKDTKEFQQLRDFFGVILFAFAVLFWMCVIAAVTGFIIM